MVTFVDELPRLESTADCCCVCLLTDNAEISVGSVGGTL